MTATRKTTTTKPREEAYYEKLLERNPDEFMAILDHNLAKSRGRGSSEEDEAEEAERGEGEAEVEAEASTAVAWQLNALSSRQQHDHKAVARMLVDFRNDDGDSLAHTAATFHSEPAAMTRLVHLSPGLLLAARAHDYEGQTPLHVVVAKGNLEMAQAILEHPRCLDESLGPILSAEATGSKFENTVMMGQLPLSVAALNFDEEMVELLILHGANVCWRNREGDTVLHSLIRFTSVHSDKIAKALDMIRFIKGKLARHQADIWHTAKDKDRLTPLKLAASLGQVEIFTAILEMDGVYRSLNAHDGLFDIHLYDITEIDTVTQAEWERYQVAAASSRLQRPRLGIKGDDKDEEKEKPTPQGCLPLRSTDGVRSWRDDSHRAALRHKAPAVLDIICRLPVRQAFEFISTDVVKELIRLKWDYYKWFFCFWAAYHLAIMIHITTFAIYKTEYINSEIYNNSTYNSTTDSEITSSGRTFVDVSAGLILIYALLYLFHELVRSFYFRQGWHLKLIQHNGVYRLMLSSFSLALLADVAWFYALPRNSYFLIVALVLGWTFMSFFLRAWRRFSFYTVMFQKVLLGDMTRLSVIILFQLVAFSVAIYTVFLSTRPVPEGFGNAGLTMMTMFKLMLGLDDVTVLYDAREPWLAIVLYVAFVLVTYVLLVNSLIAMMSRTCELVTKDRARQWELQRLSAMLLLETLLLPRWRYLHRGGVKAVRRYGMRSHDFRCYIEITSIQTTYREGRAVLERKAMIDTLGFTQGVGGGVIPYGFDPALAFTHGGTDLQPIDEESVEEEDKEIDLDQEEGEKEDTDLSRDMKFEDSTSDDDGGDDDNDDGRRVVEQSFSHNVTSSSMGSDFQRSQTLPRKNKRKMGESFKETDKAVWPKGTSTPRHGRLTLTKSRRQWAEVTQATRALTEKRRYREALQKIAMLSQQLLYGMKVTSWAQAGNTVFRSSQRSRRGGKISSVNAPSSFVDATDDRQGRNGTTKGPTTLRNTLESVVAKSKMRKMKKETTLNQNAAADEQTGCPVRVDEPVLQSRHGDALRGQTSLPQGPQPHDTLWPGHRQQESSAASPGIDRVSCPTWSGLPGPRTESQSHQNRGDDPGKLPITVTEAPQPALALHVQPVDITFLDSQA